MKKFVLFSDLILPAAPCPRDHLSL